MKLYQITEDDLVELERIAPEICDALGVRLGAEVLGSNRLRTQLRRQKEILSNVRWGYGPPLDVQVVTEHDSAGESSR